MCEDLCGGHFHAPIQIRTVFINSLHKCIVLLRKNKGKERGGGMTRGNDKKGEAGQPVFRLVALLKRYASSPSVANIINNLQV